MSLRFVASGVAAVAVATAACSTEPATDREAPSSNTTFDAPAGSFDLAPDAVIAPRAFSDHVTLQGDLVIVPTGEGHERSRAFVSGLRNRTLLVADRDHLHPLATSGNPTGFVRRIVRVDEGRLEARITTEPGELDEVFAHGDLVWHDDSAPILPRPTDSVAGPSEGAELRSAPPNGQATCRALGYTRPTLLTSNAGVTLTLTPRLEVEACHDETYRKRRGAVPRDVRSALEVRVAGALGLVLEATGFGSLHGVFSAPAVHLPLPGPVPTTLALTPVATCDATARGPARATAEGSLRFHAQGTLAFTGGAGLAPTSDAVEASASFVPTTDARAETVVTCEVSFGVALLTFDAPRFVGHVAPSLELRERLCLPDRALSVREGAALELAGRVRIPELGRLVEGEVAVGAQPDATRLVVGDTSTCEGTSAEATCAGKADGWWCDPSNRSAALRCDGGRYAGEKRCADGSCVADAQGRAALDARAELVCR